MANNVREFIGGYRHAANSLVGMPFFAHLYRSAIVLVIVGALGETLSLGKDRVEMADKSKKAPKKPKQMPRQQQQQRQDQMGEDSQGMTRAGQDDRREQRRPGHH
ncbi:hypothetical protein ACFVAV_26865 [Nocardia sp. NPDC057663]|uniref:hypothetical protein n=1 Tax=Nocardia sp. NPDC057663 TaxID=3346201 RepID=UPI00366AF81F